MLPLIIATLFAVVIAGFLAVYTFSLPGLNDILGLPIDSLFQHVQLKAKIDGKDVSRSYTPVSKPDQKGFCDLAGQGLKMNDILHSPVPCRHLDGLKIGETILMRGPVGMFTYTKNMCAEIIMLAGGSGITPMYQIIDAILSNSSDSTIDILLRDELDAFASKHDNFDVHYVLEKAPPAWTGSVGYVNADARALSQASDQVFKF
ncbi:hypothetical protein BC829DRAFT_424482 [Chytridium lagenaria]|nr:hypothetical protein BC829DRAFT_424482 [Chytridium lagenaria]